MKVTIASTVVPFVRGGGTFIVDWLEVALQERGHEVDVLRLPFPLATREVPAAMVGLRLLDTDRHGDRLVTIRYPSHLLRHPAKAVWFIHHQRTMFDLWGTYYQELAPGPEAERYREMLTTADRVGLSEARGLFSNSRIVAERVRHFNGMTPTVLYPPVLHPERFRNDGYGDYLFYPSRLARNKRQALAIEAMRYVCTPVRLVLAGLPDDPSYADTLRELVRELDLEDRVVLLDQWITEDEKVELLAGCLAVPYLAFAEDSYGYPSLEAHHAGKGVVALDDSGGALELVVDGLNGRVVKAHPVALAECFDELWEDRELAARLGSAGEARLTELGIDWDRVVDRLLA